MQTFTKDELQESHLARLDQKALLLHETLKMPLKPQRKGRNNYAT
jgi:hypothetical protein